MAARVYNFCILSNPPITQIGSLRKNRRNLWMD